MQKRIFAILILIVIIPLFIIGWKIHSRAAPAQAAESYIRSLVSGDTSGALKYSSGSAAWAAKKETNTSAGIADIEISIPNIGNNWCEALAYVEVILSDNTHDAGWYQLNLINQRGWKVYSLSETTSLVSGLWSFASKSDVQGAEKALTAYLEMLSQNKYQEASGLLCGPARRAHEAGADTLKGALFKQAGNVALAPLWKRDNQMICKASYEIDERKVSAVVQFVKLQDGWHILKINQN